MYPVLGIDGKDLQEIVVVRYLRESGSLTEVPLALIVFKASPSGQELAESIYDLLRIYMGRLDGLYIYNKFTWSNILGIVFDTTAVNSGVYRGVANRLPKLVGSEFRAAVIMCSYRRLLSHVY